MRACHATGTPDRHTARVQVLCGDKNGPLRTATNYLVAILGVVCTFFGTTASMKSLAAKAASVAAGGA
jgi:hypothetical protein